MPEVVLRKGAASAMIGAVLLFTLSGCGSVPVELTSPSPTDALVPHTSERDTSVPDGVSVSIYQTRSDFAIHQLEVSVTNDTGQDLTVTRLIFVSSQFVEMGTWANAPSTLRAGVTVDLPVSLGDANCDAVGPRHEVEFDFLLEDGTSGTARLEPQDRYDRMPALMTEDCIAQSVATVVKVTATTLPRVANIDGHEVAEVDLDLRPTGSPGTVAIQSISATTLFTIVDPSTGKSVSLLGLSRPVSGRDEPSVLTLLLAPARCDLHAIAEDKRGTIFPIEVAVGATTGRIFVTSTDEVKAALYAFITGQCTS